MDDLRRDLERLRNLLLSHDLRQPTATDLMFHQPTEAVDLRTISSVTLLAFQNLLYLTPIVSCQRHRPRDGQ